MKLFLGNDQYAYVRRIDLGYTAESMTDSDLKDLQLFTYLSELDISSTKVTDRCIDDLIAIRSLELLFIRDTNISDSAIRRLQIATPQLTIIRR